MFPENFGAEEVLDLTSGQTLDDWKTFYDGADRLIQHLKANGYSGTILTVAADSGTIYPSGILESTPIFDSGRFFSSGQDPIPKDVVEMLCRMFDREGLTLVPGLSLSGPIPKLENLIRSSGRENLRPVDFRGEQAAWSNDVPVYSALNSVVQQRIAGLSPHNLHSIRWSPVGLRLAYRYKIPGRFGRCATGRRSGERLDAGSKLVTRIKSQAMV